MNYNKRESRRRQAWSKADIKQEKSWYNVWNYQISLGWTAKIKNVAVVATTRVGATNRHKHEGQKTNNQTAKAKGETNVRGPSKQSVTQNRDQRLNGKQRTLRGP